MPRSLGLTSFWFVGWIVSVVEWRQFVVSGFHVGSQTNLSCRGCGSPHRTRFATASLSTTTSTSRALAAGTVLVGSGIPTKKPQSELLVKDTTMVLPDESPPQKQEKVAFSHVHLYADHLEELHVYKSFEDQLNQFATQVQQLNIAHDATAKQQVWQSIIQQGATPSSTETGSSGGVATPSLFVSHGRDVVKQLLAGLGFRITAACYPQQGPGEAGTTSRTRTVLVTSPDPRGVQILITSLAPTMQGEHSSPAIGQGSPFLDADRVKRFYEAHAQRPGIAVLGFLADNVPHIYQRYQTLHPDLVAYYKDSNENDNDDNDNDDNDNDPHNGILEVFAYYNIDRTPDTGTVLRFVPTGTTTTTAASATTPLWPLPGLVDVPATFGATTTTQPAYCDHWVSNVWSRTEFLDTLRDTLGFTPKVDFNAGVVAAGEAQIESTVTGNDSTLRTTDRLTALKDQSQVYLPINNALSDVGHVHGFLRDLGQGIQHLASRVENLVDFVQNANDARQALGEGFAFLRIPRSYYGTLDVSQLLPTEDASTSTGLSTDCAASVVAALRAQGVVAADGAVDLDVSRDTIRAVLDQTLEGEALAEYQRSSDSVLEAILRSRYRNLYSLLRDHLSETTYLRIVRNQILVDIQGEDLLFQIFTANILQRQAGDEAPFFEFIQRVCSECVDETGCPLKVRPGCGGFGIRNFLTLFLSIEVSKAMQDASDAQSCGDVEGEAYAQQMVQYFTDQLNESNPILTEIADAMTDEGHCQEQLSKAQSVGHTDEAALWNSRRLAAAERKRLGNDRLMACSARYNSLMKALREGRASRRI